VKQRKTINNIVLRTTEAGEEFFTKVGYRATTPKENKLVEMQDFGLEQLYGGVKNFIRNKIDGNFKPKLAF
jgi:hypothetical protein